MKSTYKKQTALMTDLPANVRPTVRYDTCLYKYTGNSKNPPKHSLPARKEGIGNKSLAGLLTRFFSLLDLAHKHIHRKMS